MDDGSLTWRGLDVEDRWEVEEHQLKLFFGTTAHSAPMGTLPWGHEVDGTILTSDVVAGDCGTELVEILPESPDWTFELQADS